MTLKRLLVFFFSSIGFLVALLLVIGIWEASHFFETPVVKKIDEDTILTFRIGRKDLSEKESLGGFLRSLMKGGSESLDLKTIVKALIEAKIDPHVKGVFLILEGSAMGYAQTQEIRDVLKEFQSSGKKIYAYADTFGESSNGTLPYYLASIADKVFLQPMGSVCLTGISVEMPFIRKLLDNFKVHPKVTKREEFKSAMESFTETDFSGPAKENSTKVLQEIVNQMCSDISQSRKIEKDQVLHLINIAPFLAEEAISQKLIDQIAYFDEVKDLFKKIISDKATFLPIVQYARFIEKNASESPTKIALIVGEGMIVKTSDDTSQFSVQKTIGARSFARDIHKAAHDPDVKAIIIRLNSGGGSAVGSESIWRSIQQAESLGKPVIISMSDYAASGGYWLATAARKIVAQPGTLTGSIGVVAGKAVTKEAWEHYGINWGEIHIGDNAQMWSQIFDYTSYGQERLNVFLDDIYSKFIQKVSEGRKLEKEKVRSIAKGQVWTGEIAKTLGLVDELGGLNTAIQVAKKEAGISADEKISLVDFPKIPGFTGQLMGLGEDETISFGILTPLFHAVKSIQQICDYILSSTKTEPLATPQMVLK
jgi:protease-4